MGRQKDRNSDPAIAEFDKRESVSVSKSARIVHGSKWFCFLFALLTPCWVYGTLHITFSTATISQWLPTSGEERERYSQFLEWFEDDLFLLVSWPGCNLDDPRLSLVAESLRNMAAQDSKGLVRRVVTSADVVESLSQGPARLSRAAAAQRLQGFLIGRDGTCAILIELSQAAQDRHALVLDLLLRAAKESAGLTRADLKLGGCGYEAVFIDEASARSLKWFVVPSFLAALLMTWICIGEVWLTLVSLTLAGYGQLLGVALLYFTGGQLNAVLIVLPTLLFMLTMSAAVHLVNYYRDAGGAMNPLASVLAIRGGWLPCALSTVTTAIGLMSLTVSDLQPIREFGFFATIGLLSATTVLLTCFPFLASLGNQPAIGGVAELAKSFDGLENRKSWRLPLRPNATVNDSFPSGLQMLRRSPRGLSMHAGGWCRRSMGFVLDHARLVVSVCLVILMIAIAGLPQLASTVRVENMFDSNSEILRNYTWLEKHVGPLVSVEVICNFDSACELNELDRVRLIQQIHEATLALPEVGGVFSAFTFLPEIPSGGGIGSTARRAVLRKRLQQDRELLIEEGVLAVNDGVEHWRVSARVPAIYSLGYGEQRNNVADACRRVVREAHAGKGISIDFTGLSPIFHEAQQLLLTDLTKSYLLAFILISPIMMIVLRGVVSGGLAMLPNVAPVALVCGTMGWIGIPVDIASILTVSVALGIAIDDTLHFVTWFSRAKRSGLNQRQSVEHAFGKCAAAMLQTTLICCCAMLAFTPAEFLPTRKYAILMSLMLVAAIFGDLILLPAMLTSRLGSWLGPNKSSRTQDLENPAN